MGTGLDGGQGLFLPLFHFREVLRPFQHLGQAGGADRPLASVTDGKVVAECGVHEGVLVIHIALLPRFGKNNRNFVFHLPPFSLLRKSAHYNRDSLKTNRNSLRKARLQEDSWLFLGSFICGLSAFGTGPFYISALSRPPSFSRPSPASFSGKSKATFSPPITSSVMLAAFFWW